KQAKLSPGDLRYLHSIRSISGQITLVLTMEALALAVGGAFFANALLPSVGGAVMRRTVRDVARNMQRAADYYNENNSSSDNASSETFTPPQASADQPESAMSPQSSADQSGSAIPPQSSADQSESAMPPQISPDQPFPGNPPDNGIGAPWPDRGERASVLGFLDSVDVLTDEDFEDVFILNNDGLAFDLKLVLLLFSTALPLVTFANYLIQMHIARPIIRMAAFANEFASGDEETRQQTARRMEELKVPGNSETKVLYQALRSTFNEINMYVVRLKEEQRLEEDLRVAQKASEAKSSFLSNMSHEIRTPINAVLGLDEMILRESSDPQTLSYAQDIQNSGKSLLSLVNDILDFSKIEAGKMEIIPVEYELSSTINDLVNMIRVKADAKGLELHVHVNKEIPHLLFGDEVRIKQCVLNVLTNAVKYTEKGSVTFRVDYVPSAGEEIALTFQVVDTGIGIKEEDLVKLYSPFERIEEARNRTIEGTGLGMSIVKNLLAMMDSQLVVKSVYGEGSDFSFTVKQRVVKPDPIGNFQETYRATAGAAKKYQEKFHAPDARILVVDDTPMNLTVAKGLLKATKVQVDTATSGEETLIKAAKTHYDLMFIDHRMPKMDGIETLAALKKMPDNLNQDTPCIALTANAVAGAREQYLEAGFTDYLSKPIDGAKLENMLLAYLPKEKVQEAEKEQADLDGNSKNRANQSPSNNQAAFTDSQFAETGNHATSQLIEENKYASQSEFANGQFAEGRGFGNSVNIQLDSGLQNAAMDKTVLKSEFANEQFAEGSGFGNFVNSQSDYSELNNTAANKSVFKTWFTGLDYEAGLQNCMTEEILRDAISDFYDSVLTKPQEIQSYLDSGDIKTYTVEVHALKSSARLIGAQKLSAMAEEMEKAGNAEDIAAIQEKTPALLELYSKYKTWLEKPQSQSDSISSDAADSNQSGEMNHPSDNNYANNMNSSQNNQQDMDNPANSNSENINNAQDQTNHYSGESRETKTPDNDAIKLRTTDCSGNKTNETASNNSVIDVNISNNNSPQPGKVDNPDKQSSSNDTAGYENANIDSTSELDAIPPEQLEEAYMGIREFADAFDFDSAAGIIEMLSAYAVPETEKEKLSKLRKALRAGDREKALELLL
ncbi:MAG: response regulator, partial [Lachnospiraceae bacterium]|nr:response regulator [Lachnospiraceae bacterium]